VILARQVDGNPYDPPVAIKRSGPLS
jgi:hypothetical protein